MSQSESEHIYCRVVDGWGYQIEATYFNGDREVRYYFQRVTPPAELEALAQSSKDWDYNPMKGNE